MDQTIRRKQSGVSKTVNVAFLIHRRENIILANLGGKRAMEYFNFRIIPMSNGIDIIDTNRVTPVESLTGTKLMEYIETDKSLLYSERQKRKHSNKKSFAGYLTSAMGKIGGVLL